MKKLAIYLGLLLMVSGIAEARDDRSMYSIESAMNTSNAKAKLNKGITFRFGDQSHGKIVSNKGNFQANKKTNAFNKSDKEACEHVFLSAMISLQDRAVKEGANAVVNIKSFYKKNEVSSATEFECGAGNVVAGVTLMGDVVQLK